MFNYFKSFRSKRPSSPSPNERIVISPEARVSSGQDGAAFLHARSGIVFTSNRIGARIWQGLVESESAEVIAARIGREHGVAQDQAYRDAVAFIGELESHGFLSRGFPSRGFASRGFDSGGFDSGRAGG